MDKGLSAYSSTALIVVLLSLFIYGNLNNPATEDAEKAIEEIKILEQKDLNEDPPKETQKEAVEKDKKDQPCVETAEANKKKKSCVKTATEVVHDSPYGR